MTLVPWSRETLACGSCQYLRFRSTVWHVMSLPVWKSGFLVYARQDDDGARSKIKGSVVVQGAPWQLQWCGVARILNCEQIFFWLPYVEGVVCRSFGTPGSYTLFGGWAVAWLHHEGFLSICCSACYCNGVVLSGYSMGSFFFVDLLLCLQL